MSQWYQQLYTDKCLLRLLILCKLPLLYSCLHCIPLYLRVQGPRPIQYIILQLQSQFNMRIATRYSLSYYKPGLINVQCDVKQPNYHSSVAYLTHSSIYSSLIIMSTYKLSRLGLEDLTTVRSQEFTVRSQSFQIRLRFLVTIRSIHQDVAQLDTQTY